MDQLTSRVRNKGRTTGSYIEFVCNGKRITRAGRGGFNACRALSIKGLSQKTGYLRKLKSDRTATGFALSHPV